MNLDSWKRSFKYALVYNDEQKKMVDRLVKNAYAIDVPLGLDVGQVKRILNHAVLALATDWQEIRDEIELYKAALPYLEKVGCVDKVPRPLGLVLNDLPIVGKRESSTDRARAVKLAVVCATDWKVVSVVKKEVEGEGNLVVEKYKGTTITAGKPCYALVADILNAVSDPEDGRTWDSFNVNRL